MLTFLQRKTPFSHEFKNRQSLCLRNVIKEKIFKDLTSPLPEANEAQVLVSTRSEEYFPHIWKVKTNCRWYQVCRHKNITAWNEIYVFIFYFQIIPDMPEFQILENKLTSNPCLASPRGWTLHRSKWCKKRDNATLSQKRKGQMPYLGEYFSIHSFRNGLQNHQNQCQPG